MYIKSTNNFDGTGLWIKKSVPLVFFAFILSLSNLNDRGIFYVLFAFVLALGFFVNPVDDVAVDSTHFYVLKRSRLSLLSKIEKLEIAKIKVIRSGGHRTKSMTLLSNLAMRSGGSNTIEITFLDDSYRSIDVQVYKDELIDVVSVVKRSIAMRKIAEQSRTVHG